MGAFSDFDFDLDERLQMVKQVEQNQIEQKAHIDHWIQQKLSVDPSNQSYQEARDWSSAQSTII